MKKLLLTLGIIIILVGCGSSVSKDSRYKTISNGELKSIIDKNENILIVDVRSPQEFEDGHIENAINIPNDTIENSEIKVLDDKDKKIVLYCRSGSRSKEASQKLLDMGYKNIYDFGSINNWDGKLIK